MVKNVKDIKGQPRSHAELDFALSLIPCPGCGATGPPKTESGGDPTFRPIYWWTCPGCGAERAYRFRIWPVLPYDGPPTAHLGGDEPSRIIPADSFAAEARRLVPLLRHEPETLAPDDWHPAWATLIRLRTCLNELAKFDGRDLTDERERADALHARYNADAPRNTARYSRHVPAATGAARQPSTGSSRTGTAPGSGADAPAPDASTSPTSTRSTSTWAPRTCDCPGSRRSPSRAQTRSTARSPTPSGCGSTHGVRDCTAARGKGRRSRNATCAGRT